MNRRLFAVAVPVVFLALNGCVTAPPAAPTGPPVIASIETDPAPPVAPRIRWTVKGSNFNPESIRVIFTGPGCPDGCDASGAIDRRTSTEVSGLADLAVGTYNVTVRNGTGAPSNAAPITLVGK